jgi:uncharacterized protein (DUF1015 family)
MTDNLVGNIIKHELVRDALLSKDIHSMDNIAPEVTAIVTKNAAEQYLAGIAPKSVENTEKMKDQDNKENSLDNQYEYSPMTPQP